MKYVNERNPWSLIFLFFWAYSCGPSPSQQSSNQKGSTVAPDLQINDEFEIKSDFCSKADGIHLGNATVLAALAGAAYSDIHDIFPYLKEMGFGYQDPQKNDAFTRTMVKDGAILSAIHGYYEDIQPLQESELNGHPIDYYKARWSLRDYIERTMDSPRRKKGKILNYLAKISDEDTASIEKKMQREYTLYKYFRHHNNVPMPELVHRVISPESNLNRPIAVYWNRKSTSRALCPIVKAALGRTPEPCDLAYDSQLFWAENDDLVVISIRGSEISNGLEDVLTSITAYQSPITHWPKRPHESPPSTRDQILIHGGFLAAADDIWDQFLANKIRSVRGKKIYFTGHSLGGALAKILAYRTLYEQATAGNYSNKVQGVYSFGSPRVGEQNFKKDFESLAKKQGTVLARFRNGVDTVTRIPSDYFRFYVRPYQHVGSYIYLDDKLFGGKNFPFFRPDGFYLANPNFPMKLKITAFVPKGTMAPIKSDTLIVQERPHGFLEKPEFKQDLKLTVGQWIRDARDHSIWRYYSRVALAYKQNVTSHKGPCLQNVWKIPFFDNDI